VLHGVNLLVCHVINVGPVLPSAFPVLCFAADCTEADNCLIMGRSGCWLIDIYVAHSRSNDVRYL
jgi:hypothetical protein